MLLVRYCDFALELTQVCTDYKPDFLHIQNPMIKIHFSDFPTQVRLINQSGNCSPYLVL